MKKRRFLPFRWEDVFRPWEKVPPGSTERYSVKDVVAMILAALSILLPWVLAIMGALTLVLFLVYKFYLRQ